MNDFLQSLRSGNLKPQRPGVTRKTQDYTYHSVNQRYQYYSSTQGNAYPVESPQESADHEDGGSAVLMESIERLARNVEKIAENQRLLISAQEKSVAVIERQTLAIEKIMGRVTMLQES